MTRQTRHWTRGAFVALTALAAATLVVCSHRPMSVSSTQDAAPTANITVFAAASLTEAFTKISEDFEAANSGINVELSFAGSSTLATQIIQGAPSDVFAAASRTTMNTVIDTGNGDGTPTLFAHNQLVIAVPKGNRRGIAGLADLTKPGLKVAVCAEQVPCGEAAMKAFRAAGVHLIPATLERDVKSALWKVRLGEVDAALVYRTDARSAPSEVDGIEFPESAAVINDYQIVVLHTARNKATARAFLAYVCSSMGQEVLAQFGFQVLPPGVQQS